MDPELVRRNEQIVELALEGLTLQQIGDRFGITRERVRQILEAKTRNVTEGHRNRVRSKVTVSDRGCWFVPDVAQPLSWVKIHRRALGVTVVPKDPVRLCGTEGCINPAHLGTRGKRVHVLAKINAESKRLDNGCREWIGPCSASGYPVVSVWGGVFAHRASWIVHNGDISSETVVRRVCGNRLCIEIQHLKLGTRGDTGSQGDRGHKGPPITDEELLGWVKDIQAGSSLREVMEKYDRPYTYVSYASTFLRSGRASKVWGYPTARRVRRFFESRPELIGGPRVGVDTTPLPEKVSSPAYSEQEIDAVIDDLRAGISIAVTAKKHGRGAVLIGHMAAVLVHGRDGKAWGSMPPKLRRYFEQRPHLIACGRENR